MHIQLPNLQSGFPPDISKPVHREPCRQGHEQFFPTSRDIDFVIFPSNMINATLFIIYGKSDKFFNILFRFSAVFYGMWVTRDFQGTKISGTAEIHETSPIPACSAALTPWR